MGYRTIVVLYNDRASDWEKDKDLGRKISNSLSHELMGSQASALTDLGYGKVVECTHADNSTLALIEGYRYNPIAHGFWRPKQSYEDLKVDLLRSWADKLGYRLVKKSVKE